MMLDADADENIPVEQFLEFMGSSRMSAMKGSHEAADYMDEKLTDRVMSPEELFSEPGASPAAQPKESFSATNVTAALRPVNEMETVADRMRNSISHADGKVASGRESTLSLGPRRKSTQSFGQPRRSLLLARGSAAASPVESNGGSPLPPPRPAVAGAGALTAPPAPDGSGGGESTTSGAAPQSPKGGETLNGELAAHLEPAPGGAAGSPRPASGAPSTRRTSIAFPAGPGGD